jgi:hypothetical protein
MGRGAIVAGICSRDGERDGLARLGVERAPAIAPEKER